jgi:hypothetical protein
MIRSELKYLIGAKGVGTGKWNHGPVQTLPRTQQIPLFSGKQPALDHPVSFQTWTAARQPGTVANISPGIVVSPCKVFDLWFSNPSLGGRDGSGPSRPPGRPREYTWITARVEVRLKGGSTSSIQIFVSTGIDNQVASERVVWTFCLEVGVRIGLQGVTMESSSGG